MEVYMKNLPRDLSEYGLEAHLTPFVQALDIIDWSCRKPRMRPNGYISFLHMNDGERFLRQHGEQHTGLFNSKGQPRTKARLTILNTLIYCQPSRGQPEPFLLRALKKTAHDRREAELQPDQDKTEHRNVSFTAKKLSCGYYGYNAAREFVYSPEVEWMMTGGIAKFARSQLIITFTGSSRELRVEIPYRTIEAVVTSSTESPSLTLTLWEAPRFFRKSQSGLEGLMSSLQIVPGLNQPTVFGPEKHRLTELPYGTTRHSDIIGQCLVYRVEVSAREFYAKVDALRKRDVLSISPYTFSAMPLYNQSMADGLEAFAKTLSESVTFIPFDVRFQLQALVQNGYLLPWTADRLIRRLSRLYRQANISTRNGAPNVATRNSQISAAAVKKLFSQIPFPSPDIDPSTFDVDEIMAYLEKNEQDIQTGLDKELISERAKENLTMVYKVQITPTSIMLLGPEPEAKNRILRKFIDFTDHFVRVQFCDEDGQDFRFNSKVCNDAVYDRFLHILNKGISVGARKYDFLGFSHSSLRSHGTFFMAPFSFQSSLQTYSTVISELGSFADIWSPARCAARIGQAFSETPFTIPLAASGVKYEPIDDIRSKDGSRVFTDGVATISQEVVDDIHAALPSRRKEPTCFQIRWGGAKGMLALDTTLSGRVMRVRPSMIKFPSDDLANLEICDTANKPIPLVLNRQMIKILEDMAVPNSWFFQEQNKELDRLRLITAQTCNTVAFLKRQKIADQLGLPQLIGRLERIGIDYKKDRFLCSIVEAVVLRELRLLKHKARIPIEKGVTLFGIVDEFGFLEEGEIYITFDKSDIVQSSYLALDKWEMIVTRSPALHPGDIQLAVNIIPPSDHPLRALKNCIVFSQKGDRDLPSQLSGGDLDGDIYNIIWDQCAVRRCLREFKPADYPRVEPLNIGRQVTREDMTSFFVEFMKTDNLGLIAVKHMILADQKDAGTFDKDCQLLAQMHSTGVDYSKTGIPVEMSLLRNITSNRYRPEFLAPAPPTNIKNRTDIIFEAPTAPAAMVDADDDEGPRYIYYHSEKILGQLYGAIDEKKIWNEDVHVDTKNVAGPEVWNGLLQYVTEECEEKLECISWNRHVEEAWDIRQAYEDAISTATMDYSEHASKCISELEVFTGNIFNKSGVQTRRQRDKSIQLKDEIDRITQWAEGMIRKRRMASLANEKDDDNIEDDSSVADSDLSLELSIACLHVGCSKERRNRRGGWGRRSDGGYHSFKVVAACCLIKELDLALRRAEYAAGAALVGGGYVGVRGARRPR